VCSTSREKHPRPPATDACALRFPMAPRTMYVFVRSLRCVANSIARKQKQREGGSTATKKQRSPDEPMMQCHVVGELRRCVRWSARVLANAGTAELPQRACLPPCTLRRLSSCVSSRLSACPCLNYVLLNNYGRRVPFRRRSGVLLRMFCCRQAASKPPLSSSLASHLMSTP